MADDPSPDPAIGAERIWAEVARVTAGIDFARAPVMRRLLEFLVTATLDGRGEQLKAYSVAVDGLGRPEDFDAQADSYPRVQVGRLRRMLDAFYAREGERGGLRLSIPSGRYRVVFEAGDAPADARPAPAPAVPALRGAAPWAIFAGAAFALVVAIALGWWALGRGNRAAAALPSAPVLKLAHLRASPAMDAVEIDADALLLDGLRRSWIARVRPDDRLHGTGDGEEGPPAYLLGGDVSGGGQPTLRLRLMRGGSGELVWTGQVPLPADRGRLRDALAPLVADIIQPYGVIATDQRARAAAVPGPGYPCMLRFDQYRRDRSQRMHALVRDCVERTLAADERDAPALAARSILALDDRLYGFAPERRDAASVSLGYARRAVVADPYSAVAHLSLARASVFTGNCPAAVRSGRRAVALNPHDPDLTAIVGLALLHCGDAGAEPLLRHAIALDPDAPAPFFAPLVFLALERGDRAAAHATANAMAPSPNATSTFYDVVLAVVAAADGDVARAKAAWARVARADARIARDPRILFERWMLPDALQAKVLGLLAGVGLIGAVR